MINSSIFNSSMTLSSEDSVISKPTVSNLSQAKVSLDYVIKEVNSGDAEIAHFLFTLGCFKGETITLISILSESYVISIKDARYSIGSDLAEAILI
jgi:Fe2+ transport system protein FeoA